MRYFGRIDFSSFSIAVSLTDKGFRCQKFVNISIVRDAYQVTIPIRYRQGQVHYNNSGFRVLFGRLRLVINYTTALAARHVMI